MADKYGILIDLDRCQGCMACEVACKQENDLPVGPRLKQVMTLGPEKIGKKLVMEYLPVMCMHCNNMACAAVCSSGAIVKNAYGVTLVNEKKCQETDKNDCKKACIEACPFPVKPAYNPEKDIVQICNMCMQRVTKGEKPSCVKHCITQCLHFGTEEEIKKLVAERGGKTISVGGVVANAACNPAVWYLPPKKPYTQS